MKNLTLIFNHLEDMHLGKDVFLVPCYLRKVFDLKVEIVCPETPTNKSLDKIVRGIPIIKLPYSLRKRKHKFYISSSVVRYLVTNRRNIDVLMTFHCGLYTFLMAYLYKLLRPDGKVYIKSDGTGALVWMQGKSYIKRSLYQYLLGKIDLISIENKEIYDKIDSVFPASDKYVHMPNAFDEDLIEEYGVEEKSFAQKENLFITVGRLGSFQKNTSMLLRAIQKIDLKGWKVVLIGPIETEERNFQVDIDMFYRENPELIGKVVFTGAIQDKKQLWDYYNRAKVFVLTSRNEAFPIVFSEVYRFSNYLLTTDVGGVNDMFSWRPFGAIVHDEVDLANNMQVIVDGGIDFQKLFHSYEDRPVLSWEDMVRERLSHFFRKNGVN